MPDIYLYFPKCKITRADSLSEGTVAHCTLLIRSLGTTPVFYPQHPLLKGKAEFFYKLDVRSQTFEWRNNYHDLAKKLFGEKTYQASVRGLLKKEVSVLVRFNSEADIKLLCIGFGLPEEDEMLFNTTDPEECRPILKKARLEYALGVSQHKKIPRRKI